MLENRNKIKALICDDSAFSRVMLRRIIESDPGIQVVDIARNGEEAIEKAIRLRPDVITLDIHMPVVDGLTALKDIVRLKIAPVIMLSAATPEDAQATVEAMEAGAFDFIVKPDEIQRMDVHSAAVIQKLKQAAASNIYGKLQKNQQPKKKNDKVSFLSSFPPKSSSPGGKGFKGVALGLSIGGFRSIFKVLPHLPPDQRSNNDFRIRQSKALQHIFMPCNCECSERSSYKSRSRVHDKIYMVHRNGPLKGFKAAKRQTPNFPSPPFFISMVTQPGSSCSLTPLKAQKPPGHKDISTQSQVSPPSCLCVLVAPYT